MAKLGLAPTVSGADAWLAAIGELTPRTVTALEKAVDELVEQGVRTVTIDLRQLSAVDTEAVDALVAAAARACEGGAAIRVCADPATHEMLETAKTLSLFAAIDDALASADSMKAFLEVCSAEADDPPEVESVTWVCTDEDAVKQAID